MNMNMNYTAYYPRYQLPSLSLSQLFSQFRGKFAQRRTFRSLYSFICTYLLLYRYFSRTDLCQDDPSLLTRILILSPPVSPSTVSYFAAPPGSVAAQPTSAILPQHGALVRMQGLPYSAGVKDILSFFQGYQVRGFLA